MELDLVKGWTGKPLGLDQEEADKDVYEFDLTLWNLLSRLAKECPNDAASQFSLDSTTIQKLAEAMPSQLNALASGVLISFQLETSEKTVIDRLTDHYDPIVIINQHVEEFDAAYWILLNRVAAKDPAIAKEVFGISQELAEQVARATHSQLRYIAGSTLTYFTLRFAQNIVEEILDESLNRVTHAVLKKFQQSLQGRRKWR